MASEYATQMAARFIAPNYRRRIGALFFPHSYHGRQECILTVSKSYGVIGVNVPVSKGCALGKKMCIFCGRLEDRDGYRGAFSSAEMVNFINTGFNIAQHLTGFKIHGATNLDQMYQFSLPSALQAFSLGARGMAPWNLRVFFNWGGEPLLNIKELVDTIWFIQKEYGTIPIHFSTIGIPGKIVEFSREIIKHCNPANIYITLSLTSPIEDVRRHLMPATAKYSLSEVWEAISEHIALFKEDKRTQSNTNSFLVILNMIPLYFDGGCTLPKLDCIEGTTKSVLRDAFKRGDWSDFILQISRLKPVSGFRPVLDLESIAELIDAAGQVLGAVRPFGLFEKVGLFTHQFFQTVFGEEWCLDTRLQELFSSLSVNYAACKLPVRRLHSQTVAFGRQQQ